MQNIEIKNTKFVVDEGMETFELNGNYAIKTHSNTLTEKQIEYYQEFQNPEFHCKEIFQKGNILYNSDCPEITELIDLIVKCTYLEKLPAEVEKISGQKIQMMGGTICPTKETIGRYKNKLFILFGRYIFGYDQAYVTFKKETFKDKVPKHKKREHVFNEDYIIMDDIGNSDKNCYDYNYAWAIIDEPSNTMDAFSLYRGPR